MNEKQFKEIANGLEWIAEYQSKIAYRLGVIIFFIVVLPLLLGFCAFLGILGT